VALHIDKLAPKSIFNRMLRLRLRAPLGIPQVPRGTTRNDFLNRKFVAVNYSGNDIVS